MRFLVFGATGMAGHTVSLYLQERGHDVIGFSRRPAPFLKQSIKGDAFDRVAVERSIEQVEPDVVVNAIGLLVADCERYHDRAVYLDAYVPHMLAALSEKHGARVFQLSTDCVFRGDTGPYTECSASDAEEFYGKVKALGELRDGRNLTLRQSIVGPDLSADGIGLLNWFMKQGGAINGWRHAIWTGLTTLELAKVIEACAAEGTSGLLNMVPDGAGISKYRLLSLFNDYMRAGEVRIQADDSFSCDKSLVRTTGTCSFAPEPYEDQVRELASWMREHSALYPHYAGVLR